MANAGFNAATDLFSMGTAWKVKSSTLNPSGSTAECPDSNGDITHRDGFGEAIAPSAEYVLVSDVTSLPNLGTVVTVDGKKVAIDKITIKTGKGTAPTATVTGKQVESNASTRRKYACGTISLTARHRAQDILGMIGSSTPSTLTESTFEFSVDVTVADPKGAIEASDVSNGKVVASFTHTVGDATAVTSPSVTGNAKVVSQPVAKSSPENDYVTYNYAVTDSLTGSETSASS